MTAEIMLIWSDRITSGWTSTAIPIFCKTCTSRAFAVAGSEKKADKTSLKAPPEGKGSDVPVSSEEQIKWRILDWKEYQRPWEVCSFQSCLLVPGKPRVTAVAILYCH